MMGKIEIEYSFTNNESDYKTLYFSINENAIKNSRKTPVGTLLIDEIAEDIVSIWVRRKNKISSFKIRSIEIINKQDYIEI